MLCSKRAYLVAALPCLVTANVASTKNQTRFVIDSSVVIPWYLEQNLTPISLLFLQRLEHCQAPGVISSHVSQVLWSYCQEDRLSGTVGAAALRHFRRAMNHKITPSEDLADRALEISLDLRLAPPLCLYFALATCLTFVAVCTSGSGIARSTPFVVRAASAATCDAGTTDRSTCCVIAFRVSSSSARWSFRAAFCGALLCFVVSYSLVSASPWQFF